MFLKCWYKDIKTFSDFKLIKIIVPYFLDLEALKYHNFALKTGDTSWCLVFIMSWQYIEDHEKKWSVILPRIFKCVLCLQQRKIHFKMSEVLLFGNLAFICSFIKKKVRTREKSQWLRELSALSEDPRIHEEANSCQEFQL